MLGSYQGQLTFVVLGRDCSLRGLDRFELDRCEASESGLSSEAPTWPMDPTRPWRFKARTYFFPLTKLADSTGRRNTGGLQ